MKNKEAVLKPKYDIGLLCETTNGSYGIIDKVECTLNWTKTGLTVAMVYHFKSGPLYFTAFENDIKRVIPD